MKHLIIILFATACLSAAGQPIRIATYNLRYENHGDSVNGNGWGQRFPVQALLIRFHDFDLFGTQEGKYHMLQNLQDSLPGYAWFGKGRDDGEQGGEHSAIFYKTARFQLLEHDDFWLSEITDRPNKGWDAALPRICTWGRFRDRKTGITFLYFNLHMDHIGVKARAESSKLVLKKVREMAGSIPTILTGDFNVDQNNESYTLINTSGLLRDAYETTRIRYATNGTFNEFNPGSKTSSRIDHIFLTRHFTVLRYAVLTDTYRGETPSRDPAVEGRRGFYARVPSDHFPVMIEAEMSRR